MMEIFEFGNPQSDIVLIQPVDDHDLEGIKNEFEEIERNFPKSFYLIAVKINDWNNELSPWKAPAVFGNEGFGDGASKTLEELLKLCADKEKTPVTRMMSDRTFCFTLLLLIVHIITFPLPAF